MAAAAARLIAIFTRLKPSIHVAPVADRHNQDDEDLIGHLVEDSIVSNPDAVEVIDTAELLAAGGTGIACEPTQATPHAGADLNRQFSERAFCGGLEANLASHGTGSEAEVGLDLFPGDAALFFQGLLCPLEVDTILEGADELEVAHRDKGGEIATSSGQDDSLAAVDNPVEGVGELLSGLTGA